MIKISIQSNNFDYVSKATSLINKLVAQDLGRFSLGIIDLFKYVYSKLI